MASQLAGFALRSLRLRSTYLDRESVQRLLKPPLLDALRHLDLTYNHIDGDDPNRPTVGQLLEKLPQGIESLKLGHNNIGPEGAQQLAQCAALGQLRTLSLRNNPIGDEGVLALARSKHLDKLRTLVLREVGASMQSVEVLLSPGTLPALEKLTIVHNKIDKARVNRLAASRNLDLSALEDFYAE